MCKTLVRNFGNFTDLVWSFDWLNKKTLARKHIFYNNSYLLCFLESLTSGKGSILAALIRRNERCKKTDENELYDDLDCSSKWTNYGKIASVVNEIEWKHLTAKSIWLQRRSEDNSFICNFKIQNVLGRSLVLMLLFFFHKLEIFSCLFLAKVTNL